MLKWHGSAGQSALLSPRMRRMSEPGKQPMPQQLRAALKAQKLGQSIEAKMLAGEWLKRNPDDPLALTILASTAIDLRRPVEAEHLLRRALDLAPGLPEARMHLARSLEHQSRVSEGIAILKEVTRTDERSLPALTFLAHLQRELGEFGESAETYERLLKWRRDDPILRVGYAEMLRFVGRKADSEHALRHALSQDPASGMAWWGLSMLDAKLISDADLQVIGKALEQSSDRSNEALLHFAVAQVFNLRARYAEAFMHFQSANRIRRELFSYDFHEICREVDASIALLSADFFQDRREFGTPDGTPIFIVGMPRSGSTLLDRMLGRHSQVEATGELPIVPRMVDMLSAQHPCRYPGLLAGLSGDQIRDLGANYLARAHEFRKTEKPLFTDKLHMNWRHLGLIHLSLPGAKIIDVRRSALDCCWSNYKLNFTRGHLASNDLADLGRFYRDYVRLMDRLTEVAPDAVLRVEFEDVVDDPERELRRVLGFLGLQFEGQCLNFHLAAEPVGTASSEQVRRPINRDGIGAWKPYEPWLRPLIEALGPLADTELTPR
jgi:tetratricopeptide (TPR) repeat protein